MRILAHTLFIFILILKLVNIYCDEAEDCTTHNIGNLMMFIISLVTM